MSARMVVTGGTVVDGTGAPAVPAEVVIVDGKVAAIEPRGTVVEGDEVIDATGCVVTPGFVDPHTHLDAQLFWDASGVPSALHGVTSVVLGNCGFGVAPCPDGGAEYLLRSLEATEEIPYRSTSAAVPMSWRSWPEFFDAIASLDLGVNVAGLVPHSALRYSVMGARALTERAGPEETAAQAAALRSAMEAGALGFASSRGPNHHDGDGNPVASRSAGDEELAALVAECAGAVWQINVATKGVSGAAGGAAVNAEVDRYAEMTRRAGARLTWTPLVVTPGDAEACPVILERNHELNRQTVVAPQVAPQAMTGSVTFDGPSFAGMVEGWQEVWAGFPGRSPAERRALLADPHVRATLRAVPSDCSRITSPCYERWRLVFSASRPELSGSTLGALAAAEGRHPVDVLFDLALEDDLATTVEVGLSNLDHPQVAGLVEDPTTLIGLGDAGAHVRSITNYTYPTFVLSCLVRDEGRLSLEAAVARMTSHPAAVLGLPDRGTLVAGGPADLCVIDVDRLAMRPAEITADLPAGARRIHRGATGYRAVVVNGTTVLRDDQPTGARSGTMIRRGTALR